VCVQTRKFDECILYVCMYVYTYASAHLPSTVHAHGKYICVCNLLYNNFRCKEAHAMLHAYKSDFESDMHIYIYIDICPRIHKKLAK
jgi:hypothetical protein